MHQSCRCQVRRGCSRSCHSGLIGQTKVDVARKLIKTKVPKVLIPCIYRFINSIKRTQRLYPCVAYNIKYKFIFGFNTSTTINLFKLYHHHLILSKHLWGYLIIMLICKSSNFQVCITNSLTTNRSIFNHIFLSLQALTFRPPLCISYENVEFTVNVLATVFEQHMKKRHRSWRSSRLSGRGNY